VYVCEKYNQQERKIGFDLTHCVVISKQASQTRTGENMANDGSGADLDEQVWQNPLPHNLRNTWRTRQEQHQHKYRESTTIVPAVVSTHKRGELRIASRTFRQLGLGNPV
jgi:hypothetical protein